MSRLLDGALQLGLVSLIALHLIAAPYTKVEESFSIQATHDILTYGIPWRDTNKTLSTRYDHAEFPGSVPRTFVGALVLAGVSSPIIGFVTDPLHVQILVRGMLGLLNAASIIYFQQGVRRAFGRIAANWYLVLQGSQFHLIYYASRTLPNMFALILTNVAFRNYMLAMSAPSGPASGRSYQRLSLYFLTVAGVVFRSEIAVLVATQTLFLLATRQASLPDTIIPAGAAGLVMGLLLSVLVDSFFWQQYPLWPELSGFYYNTILGKSSDWGVSPWHFYFTSALPRLLLNPITYALIFIAVTSPATRGRTMAILVPCLTFVGIYSILPHKEWRFIIYVVPPLTAVASVGASWLWIRRTKSALYQLLSLLLVSSVIMSLFASTGLLAVSRLNYPGGEAVSRLREIAANDTGTIRVYADNLVCQTGLTRFLESRNERDLGRRSPRWAFDKTENQTALLDPLFWKHLDYVLAESPERVIGAWQTVDVVKGFAGVQVLRPSDDVDTREEQTDHSRLPFMARVEQLGRQYVTRGWWARVRMDPKVHILRKQSEAEILQGATSVETL